MKWSIFTQNHNQLSINAFCTRSKVQLSIMRNESLLATVPSYLCESILNTMALKSSAQKDSENPGQKSQYYQCLGTELSTPTTPTGTYDDQYQVLAMC